MSQRWIIINTTSMEHIKTVIQPAASWFNFASNQRMDLNSVAYIAQAKDIAGCRGCVSADMEEKILQQTNRVHNVVTLVARSYYWIGLASNIDYKLEAGSATETQSFIESSVTGPTSGKTLILLRFREGSYVLKLFSNNKIIRAISIFVAPKRIVVPSSDCTMGATKVAILVPQNKPWIVRRINSIAMKQKYFLVAAHNGNYVYHSQRKESHSIAVIQYGDLATVSNEIKFASDVLLLWEDLPLNTVRMVADATSGNGMPFMNFTMKSGSDSGTSVNLNMLSSPLQSVMTHLNDIARIENTVVGAAIVREPSHTENYDAFDALIHDWISKPSNPYSRNVYLRFEYDNYPLSATPDMAIQFTEEILPEESIVYGYLQAGSRLQVFVSCSVYCLWVLNLSLDAVAVQYPSLISINEVFMADVVNLTDNTTFEELIMDMQHDGVQNGSDQQFAWLNTCRMT